MPKVSLPKPAGLIGSFSDLPGNRPGFSSAGGQNFVQVGPACEQAPPFGSSCAEMVIESSDDEALHLSISRRTGPTL